MAVEVKRELQKLSREQKIVITIGVSLIALGAAFLFLQLLGLRSFGIWVPIIAGAIALALAVLTRLPGFTFLGCLLTLGGGGLLFYLGVGDRVPSNVSQAIFLLFISTGLCVTPLLTRLIDKKILRWPLLPGVAGFICGIVMLL